MPLSTSSTYTHTIPSGVPTSLMLYCRLDPARLPNPQELTALTEQWIARNVPPPLSSLMPPWLHVPMTKMGPAPVDGLPAEVVGLHRANLREDAHQKLMAQA